MSALIKDITNNDYLVKAATVELLTYLNSLSKHKLNKYTTSYAKSLKKDGNLETMIDYFLFHSEDFQQKTKKD